MLLHTSEEHLFLHELLVLVVEHPITHLRVPHQAVTTQLNAVLAAEIGNLVGVLPVELALLGFGGLRLHVVFSSDAVELLLDKGNLLRDLNVVLVDGYSNGEVVLIGIFHT